MQVTNSYSLEKEDLFSSTAVHNQYLEGTLQQTKKIKINTNI